MGGQFDSLIDECRGRVLGFEILNLLNECAGPAPDDDDVWRKVRSVIRKWVASIVGYGRVFGQSVNGTFAFDLEWAE